MAVFNDNPQDKKPRLRLGYGSANKARRSIRLLKKQPRKYQTQVAHTLYYRAKYHKYQTKDLSEIFEDIKKYQKKNTEAKISLKRF
jgi:hypothetical protein